MVVPSRNIFTYDRRYDTWIINNGKATYCNWLMTLTNFSETYEICWSYKYPLKGKSTMFTFSIKPDVSPAERARESIVMQ